MNCVNDQGSDFLYVCQYSHFNVKYDLNSLPWDMTPSSSSAWNIPVAWIRVCTTGDKFMSHSTNSLPGAHFLINRPDTFRSFKHPLLSDSSSDLNAHPILFIVGLGDWKKIKKKNEFNQKENSSWFFSTKLIIAIE